MYALFKVKFVNFEKYFKSQFKGLQVLLPGVNFTNVLRAAFALVDPISAKKLLNLTVFFALLGFAHVKAARRTLVKLNPGRVSVVEKRCSRPYAERTG